jgi:hypothetical protein
VHAGTLDRTGTIEIGKRADLTLLEGNPAAGYFQHVTHCERDGRRPMAAAVGTRQAAARLPLTASRLPAPALRKGHISATKGTSDAAFPGGRTLPRRVCTASTPMDTRSTSA